VPAAPINFGEFSLDCDRYELLRAGRPIKLEKLPMELLILLVEKDGDLVTRQEIVGRLWGSDVFLDTEHGINTAIRKVRTVLRDDPEQPRFVQTVSGKGYRFIADTSTNGNGAEPATVAEPAANAKTEGRESKPLSWSISRLWLSSLILLAAIGIAAILIEINVGGVRNHWFTQPATPRIESIAVLPLENLSGDPAQDYYADGMTDEIITMLAKNAELRVISRTSVMQYKKAQRPLRDIARELGVDGILEGSVGRSGGRVHVNTQLIYAPSDTHIWAESYDRDLQDVGSLQTELAHTIARQVGLTVSAPASPQRRISPEAHDAYLMGRYYWFADSPGNYEKSRESFRKAITLQPDYAAAWSGLSDAFLATGMFGGRALRDEAAGPGGEAARKALALDDSLAEAHNSMAAYYFFYRWDWEHAERESARAVELNPGFAEGHHVRAYVLQALNRTDEALQEEKKAMELDPFARPCELTRALIHARRFDAALNEARLRAEAQPDNSCTHGYLSDAYWYKGMEREAAQEMEISFQLGGEKESAIAVHQAYARGGFQAVLEWQLSDVEKNARAKHAAPMLFAVAYAPLKRKGETLYYLEQAYREREPWLAHIQYLPYLDFLHSEPRYQAIVKEMGLRPVY